MATVRGNFANEGIEQVKNCEAQKVERLVWVDRAIERPLSAMVLQGCCWPIAEIDPVRPKRKLADEALAAKVNSRAGSRRRTTGQRPTVVRRDTTSQSGQFI